MYPAPGISDLSPAFRIVRQLLAEKPRTYQDLFAAGLQVDGYPKATSSPRIQVPPTPSRHVDLPGSLQKKRKPVDLTRVPEEHPFKSSNFFRNRVLGTLQRHGLIHKEAVRPPSGTDKISQSTRATRDSQHGSPFQFFLSAPKEVKAEDPLSKWSLQEHWNRLCMGEPTFKIKQELEALRAEQEEVYRERRLADGRERRTEREYWRWEGREPEISTKLQRLHLSRRRQRTRSVKEAKLITLRKKRDEMKAQAKLGIEERSKSVLRVEGKTKTMPESRRIAT